MRENKRENGRTNQNWKLINVKEGEKKKNEKKGEGVQRVKLGKIIYKRERGLGNREKATQTKGTRVIERESDVYYVAYKSITLSSRVYIY